MSNSLQPLAHQAPLSSHYLPEFEQTLGVGDGYGGLACCSPWGHKDLDTTEQLNWTEEERTKGYEKIFDEIIVENFSNVENEIVNQVQYVQRVP